MPSSSSAVARKPAGRSRHGTGKRILTKARRSPIVESALKAAVVVFVVVPLVLIAISALIVLYLTLGL
jgi:hypothetical protein